MSITNLPELSTPPRWHVGTWDSRKTQAAGDLTTKEADLRRFANKKGWATQGRWDMFYPWEPKTFIFRGYDPCIEGLKPSFFMGTWGPKVVGGWTNPFENIQIARMKKSSQNGFIFPKYGVKIKKYSSWKQKRLKSETTT